jgi:hypothetical protein
MTKIVISQDLKNELAAARQAGRSRSHLWMRVRSTYRIPSTVQLAVSCARELYVKGTTPKQFLHSDELGRYSHALPDPVAPTADAGRFMTATFSNAGAVISDWSRAPAYEVASVMRNGTEPENVEDNVELPPGFPADTDRDSLVFDTTTGYVYFRS